MNRCFTACASFLLAAVPIPLSAQEPAKADAPKLLTPEASLSLRSISDLQFSPDGSRLAFVVSEPPKGERRARHIWIYNQQTRILPRPKPTRAGPPTANNSRSSPIATKTSSST